MKKCIKNSTYLFLLSLLVNPVLSSASNNPVVDIQTSRGLITVQLVADTAPITVGNFLTYVDEGFYENTVFHRVINDFMIQGGGYNVDLEIQEVHAPISLETNVGLSNVRGTISMARRNDPDTASSQFFINTVDNLYLDYQSYSSPGYAVFGEVVEGMDIVDAISEQETGNVSVPAVMGGEAVAFKDVPDEPVLIEVVRLREGQLSFNAMQETYMTGEIIEVSLTETMSRQRPLDLWFAVLTEGARLLYVTQQGFSLEPSAFMTHVSELDTRHSVFELTVPQGLTGHFILLAIFNNPGAGVEDLEHSLRSNIAEISVELVQ